MTEPSRGGGSKGVNLSRVRGERTRDALLDALEAIAADQGMGALSHRSISRRARLHTGLIHYHFGTVDRLLEETLSRRATRLSQAQLSAIAALFAAGHWTVEDVVAALWLPFSALGGALEGGWRNYLCLVARLASDERGDELLSRYFDDVAKAAHRALAIVLPAADEDALSAGLRYTRILFEQEALARCKHARPAERRALEDRRLVRFAAAGLRGLEARAPSLLIDVSLTGAP